MSRIKAIVVIPLLFLLGACGGSANNDNAATRNVQIRVGEPSALASLPIDQRTMRMELSYLVEGVEGSKADELVLTPNDDWSAWNGETGAIPPGRYVARVYLDQAWEMSTPTVVLTLENQNTTRETEYVPVAVYSSPIDIVVGQNDIVIDIAPGDFSTDIDDDSDGLSNLTEIIGTTDPFDPDTDGDGFRDGLDVFPNLSAEYGDVDGDGIGDNTDNCITVPNPDQADFDGDHQGDVCDPDDDNDGLPDAEEVALGSNPHLTDTDRDGAVDGSDNCLLTPNPDQVDSDGDQLGNACDPDDDNDGVPDVTDNCPFFPSPDQTDSNHDGTGDVCTNDDDGDGVIDGNDNCRTVSNADQKDTDHDAIGDACDPDDDNDGLSDVEENTGGSDNLITSSVSADTDGDGIADNLDNCPITANPGQASGGDSDGEGDACDCAPTDPGIRTSDAVFVSTTGNDENDGARNAPLKTIAKGIALAKASGKEKVYVGGGSYAETIQMADGVSVFGGFSVSFDGSTCEKKLYDGNSDVNQVVILGPSTPVVTFTNIASETRLEGVIVESSMTDSGQVLVSISSDTPSSANKEIIEDCYIVAPNVPSGSTTAVSVVNASPILVNDVIDAGSSQESTAIELLGSPAAKIVHNTIHGGASPSASTVLHSSNSVPALLNNVLFTSQGLSQRILFFDDAIPSSSIVVRQNLMFGVQGSSPDAPKLYVDRSPSLRIYGQISQVNSQDGAASGGNFDGNIRLTSNGGDAGSTLTIGNLLVNQSAGQFRLVGGAIAIDRGLNPADVIGLQVLRDHDYVTRPVGGARDLGAFEWKP